MQIFNIYLFHLEYHKVLRFCLFANYKFLCFCVAFVLQNLYKTQQRQLHA